MKGDRTLEILEIIASVTGGVADYVTVLMRAGYGASIGRLNYEHSKVKKNYNGQAKNLARESRQRYYVMLNQLKKDGLIISSNQKNVKTIAITKRGRQKLRLLQTRRKAGLFSDQYTELPGAATVIIAFDIPEKERRKRAWLRAVLRRLGLKMVQKSVWVGKTKIPQMLIGDLQKFRLINYVEIFSVTKSGSLKSFPLPKTTSK